MIKLIFGAINALLYPLLIFVVAPFIYKHFVTVVSTGDGPSFEELDTIIKSIIVVLIISLVLAHLITRSWWIASVALVCGLFISWAGYVAVESLGKFYNENRISKYAEYYPTGELIETGHTRGSDKNGKIIRYYRGGIVKSVERYKKGELSGVCQLYHPNKQMMVEGNYKGSISDGADEIGIPDGVWVYYHKNGYVDDERTYAQGKLLRSKNFKLRLDSAGLVRTIVDNQLYTGSLVKEGIIIDTYLFPNLYTTQVIEGQFDGDVCSYYTIGDELSVASTATYRNGKIDGVLKYYHTNGQLKTDALYIDGNPEGAYTTYYADSVATEPHGKIEYTCTYKNGERNGTAQWYYENGQLCKQALYMDGSRDGERSEWNEDGTLISMYTYRADKKDGPYEEIDGEGYRGKGQYKNDRKIYQESYRPDGKLRSIYEWGEDGENIRHDYYDENGKLI